MWKCPLCGEIEPLAFQMGHIKRCAKAKKEKVPEPLVGRPGEDLGYRFFPSTREEWDL